MIRPTSILRDRFPYRFEPTPHLLPLALELAAMGLLKLSPERGN
jgi:hypothetical protein